MNPVELSESGDLAAAIEAQNSVVRAHPTDLDARYLLSVLLCFAGNLERAFQQLNVIGSQDPELGMAASVYRSLITAEAARRSFYAEDGVPLLPPDCPTSVERRVEAVQALRRGDPDCAAAKLEEARSSEAPLEAKLNGDLASDLRDHDDFLGPALEVYAGGNYLWLPFARIRRLEIAAPTHQLDLLWAPATLVDTGGTEASVHLPVLYDGSHEAEDGRVRVGRMTDWKDREGIGFRGLGQRVLLVEHAGQASEIGLLEVRSLEPTPSAATEISRG